MNATTAKILQETGKVIAGKDDVLSKVLMAVLAGGHVLLEDVPGVGKTTLALAFHRALGLSYKRIQFTPDSMPSDIVGYTVYDRSTNSFRYQPGAAMTHLLLADEINRTSSRTQSALLEVMEEGQATVDGETHLLPKPFIVLATQNPVGAAGTQILPASQMDRFMIQLRMGYPNFQQQVRILKDRRTVNPLESVQTVVDREGVLKMQRALSALYIDDSVYEYVTSLSEATRTHPMVELGLSPRGALAVCRMAQACAYLASREYVVPDDVCAVFEEVCAHRLILNRKAVMSGADARTVIGEILNTVEMPYASDWS